MKVNNAPSTAKSAVQPGIFFGVLMVLEFVIFYVLDIDPLSNPEVGVIANILNYLILPVTFISLACHAYKSANLGFISFGECLKIGVTVSVIAALIYAIFNAVFMMLFPEFVENIIQKTIAVLRTQPGMTDESLDMAISWTRKMMSPAISIPVTLLMYAFIGLILSLIIGAIMKKDKNQSSF